MCLLFIPTPRHAKVARVGGPGAAASDRKRGTTQNGSTGTGKLNYSSVRRGNRSNEMAWRIWSGGRRGPAACRVKGRFLQLYGGFMARL